MESNIPIPKNYSEFEDKKTKIKTLAFKFKFPDYSDGIVTITHTRDKNWNMKSIKSITIEYADISHEQ
jgi:hypothetical protein